MLNPFDTIKALSYKMSSQRDLEALDREFDATDFDDVMSRLQRAMGQLDSPKVRSRVTTRLGVIMKRLERYSFFICEHVLAYVQDDDP